MNTTSLNHYIPCQLWFFHSGQIVKVYEERRLIVRKSSKQQFAQLPAKNDSSNLPMIALLEEKQHQ